MNLRNWLKAFWTNEVGAVCIGCGLKTVDGILVAEISATAGNALTCTADGLYVPTTVVPGISDVACNAISDNDGLWAPCMRGEAGVSQMDSPNNDLLPINPASAGTYGFESTLVTINNAGCRDVEGTIHVQAGGLFSDALSGGMFASAHLEVDIDGVEWKASTPDTTKRVDSPGLHYADYNNMVDTNYLFIGAGLSATYKARLLLVIASGSCNLHGGVNFSFNWTLVPTADC